MTAVSTTAPRAAGVRRRHEERRVRSRPSVIGRSRSTTPQFTGTPDGAGNADGGRGPARDRRARGPGRGRSRRRSSGSAATRPVRAASRSPAQPARRTASPPPTSDSRIRVVETAANEGGASQAVSTVTDVVDELMPTASAADDARDQGRTASSPRARTRWSRSRRAPRVTLRVKVSDDRGFRVSGVQVRVTPTGLLAGPAAHEDERSPTAGPRSPSARPAPAPPTCSSRPAGRARSRRAGISTSNLFRVRVR